MSNGTLQIDEETLRAMMAKLTAAAAMANMRRLLADDASGRAAR